MHSASKERLWVGMWIIAKAYERGSFGVPEVFTEGGQVWFGSARLVLGILERNEARDLECAGWFEEDGYLSAFF